MKLLLLPQRQTFILLTRMTALQSHALSDYLSSMHNPVTLKDTDTMTLQDALYYQNVDYILTIPEGFEEQLTDSDARDFLPVSMRKDNSMAIL